VPGKEFVEGLPQGAIFPITLGAVARGEFGRETNGAVKHPILESHEDGRWRMEDRDLLSSILYLRPSSS
jgi:hypothetical protein